MGPAGMRVDLYTERYSYRLASREPTAVSVKIQVSTRACCPHSSDDGREVQPLKQLKEHATAKEELGFGAGLGLVAQACRAASSQTIIKGPFEH